MSNQLRRCRPDPGLGGGSIPSSILGRAFICFYFCCKQHEPLGASASQKRVPRAWHLLLTFPCRDGASALIQGETEAGDKQDVGEEGRANISGRSNDWNG